MEGASMIFHGDYKKRCLLTIMVSQILLLIKLISEIKYTPSKTDFFYMKLLIRNYLEQKEEAPSKIGLVLE
jgi:hypothetical protein